MTNVVHPVSDEQLPKLLAALAEAARADQRTADRFVAPRIGVLEETAARRHQFVLGRRGVGKSTLLRKIQSQEQIESNAVFVDIETLRSRPYPDVLIELLIELLTGLGERLRPDVWYRIDQLVERFRAASQAKATNGDPAQIACAAADCSAHGPRTPIEGS